MGYELGRVTFDDNGKGFDPDVVKESGSLGIKLIRERAEMLGGSFEVDSAAGKGARITFTVPAHQK
jgi:two-component system sensor histidine kinase DegS